MESCELRSGGLRRRRGYVLSRPVYGQNRTGFQAGPRIVVEEVDLCDWKTGNLVQKRVYIQGPETKAVVAQDKLFNKIQAQLDKEARAKQRSRKHAK